MIGPNFKLYKMRVFAQIITFKNTCRTDEMDTHPMTSDGIPVFRLIIIYNPKAPRPPGNMDFNRNSEGGLN